jgi:hypothetical protein
MCVRRNLRSTETNGVRCLLEGGAGVGQNRAARKGWFVVLVLFVRKVDRSIGKNKAFVQISITSITLFELNVKTKQT